MSDALLGAPTVYLAAEEVGMEARMREPYERERLEGERVTERGEPRLVERPGVVAFLQDRDAVRWGPIWGGVITAFGLLALLGAFGAAIGLTTTAVAGAPAADATAATIWGALIVAVSLFFGGYVAGRSSSIGGVVAGLAHSFLTWGTLIVVGAVLAAFGFATGLVTVAGVAGMPGAPGGAAPFTPGQPGTAWGPFVVMLIGLVAALIGGYLGGTQLRGRPDFRL